jgi:hypothetical protein
MTKDVRIQVEGGYCLGQGRPKLDHMTVDEEEGRILVTTYLRQAPFAGKSCEGLGLLVPATIHLEAPLGSRSIFDTSGSSRAGFNKPTLRWPGPEAWQCLRRLPMFRDLPEVDGRPRASGLLVYSLSTAILGNPAVTRSCDV